LYANNDGVETRLMKYYATINLLLNDSPTFIGIFGNMTGIITNINSDFHKKHIQLDMTNSYTCSFTEFLPFCSKLYYLSNFKDFNTLTQA